MFNQKDLDEHNNSIKEWNEKNVDDVLQEMDALNIQHSRNSPNKIPLRKAFSSQLKQRFGMVNQITYKMPRSAIFLHKGVSRAHGKNNPRQAKEWFNPPTDRNIDDLANRVADSSGNLVVNALNIK